MRKAPKRRQKRITVRNYSISGGPFPNHTLLLLYMVCFYVQNHTGLMIQSVIFIVMYGQFGNWGNREGILVQALAQALKISLFRLALHIISTVLGVREAFVWSFVWSWAHSWSKPASRWSGTDLHPLSLFQCTLQLSGRIAAIFNPGQWIHLSNDGHSRVVPSQWPNPLVLHGFLSFSSCSGWRSRELLHGEKMVLNLQKSLICVVI